MKIKKYQVIHHLQQHAVEIRWHNKRIVVKEYPIDPNDFVIEATSICDHSSVPRARHKSLRNKGCVTGIRYTRKAMDAICLAYRILTTVK